MLLFFNVLSVFMYAFAFVCVCVRVYIIFSDSGEENDSDIYVLIRGNEAYMIAYAEQIKHMALLTGKNIRKPFSRSHQASYMPFNRMWMASLTQNRINSVSETSSRPTVITGTSVLSNMERILWHCRTDARNRRN